jgi:hypothetical protein
MEEDFPLEGGGERMECYLWRVENEIENCVVKAGCPSGYPGVCCWWFKSNYSIYISLI